MLTLVAGGTSAFDYFHINSVDKSLTSGNYLVSARHTSTVFCVNATASSFPYYEYCKQCANFIYRTRILFGS